MEAEVSTPLNNIESSLNALISSLTTTNTFAAAPTATTELLSADDALTSALATLKLHQNNYARILHLRAEAARLQDQIKNIVRTCVALRTEAGHIHPSILEDSDAEEEGADESTKLHEVDYKTLLTFAARIGRHNAVAAREAEQEHIRRKVEAKRRADETGATVEHAVAERAAEAAQLPPQGRTNTTAESQAELERINNEVAAQRAEIRVAFPPAEILRTGALGQIQLLMERQGDTAVDAEIERMVRETEPIAEEKGEQEPVPETAPAGRAKEERVSSAASVPSRVQPPTPAEPKRKLALDFPGSDDEDDEV